MFPLLGGRRRFFDDERRERTGLYGQMRSFMYAGAKSCRALKVSSRILYSIRYSTGSQCNASRTGVMWSRNLVCETSLAAEFWIRCNLAISHFGRPKSRLLQQSSRDEINVCIRRSVVFVKRCRFCDTFDMFFYIKLVITP